MKYIKYILILAIFVFVSVAISLLSLLPMLLVSDMWTTSVSIGETIFPRIASVAIGTLGMGLVFYFIGLFTSRRFTRLLFGAYILTSFITFFFCDITRLCSTNQFFWHSGNFMILADIFEAYFFNNATVVYVASFFVNLLSLVILYGAIKKMISILVSNLTNLKLMYNS